MQTLPALALTVFSLLASPSASSVTVLPPQWIGLWQGSCHIVSYNSELSANMPDIAMTLNIRQLEASVYTWQISYENEPLRDYRLLPQDDLEGHFLLDERSGIKLDRFLAGGVMSDMFTINGKVFVSTTTVLGRSLTITSSSYWANPIRSGGLADGSNVASSFALRDLQTCKLAKVRTP